MKLSIILPCYNEAENLPLILRNYRTAGEWFNFELILVNNGSTDHTAKVLEKELAKPEYVFAKTVLVRKNIGYGYGIMTGFKVASGEFLAFSHADMQCSAEDVFIAYKKLISLQDSRKAIIKGRRYGRKFEPKIVTYIMGLIASSILLTWLTDVNAQPKIFHKSMLEKLTKPPLEFEFDLYILYKARELKFAIETIPVIFHKRLYGTSKSAYNFFNRWKTIFKTLRYIFKLRFKNL